MEKNTPLRIGVIGAGIMGQNHLRVLDLLKTVEIVAVVDTDIKKAQQQARRYDCKAFQHADELQSEMLDAVTICVPSIYHAEIGLAMLDKGFHCLIEKPLATSEADCLALIKKAKQVNRMLMVGHIERFNPAVQQLRKIIPKGLSIHAIDAQRMSSTSARITDVDVVMDLMIHDLDIVFSLIDSPMIDVKAHGVHTDDANGNDYVSALLSFESGSLATVTASRITQNKIRRLNLTTDMGFITLDYLTQELLVHRQGHIGRIGGQSAEYGNYVLDLAIERVFVRNAESLYLELNHFVDSVMNGTPPLITGEDGLNTLRAVWAIQKQVTNMLHIAEAENADA